MKDYEIYMQKCFELARQGEGKVSPNPLVGCVVLDKFGNEIANGYHAKYEENHAERDALLKLQDEAEGGTLIVNLEPCSHFGKTPPCVDLIIEKGIKTVVIAMKDVNPIVCGNGIKKLISAGINVIDGVLEREARSLNEVFIKNMKEKSLFIALKTASTLDGKIATANGSSKWITSDFAREKVMHLRQAYDAVLTTSNTVIADNPSFDCPVKVLLDRNLRTDFNAKYFQTGKIFVAIDQNVEPQIQRDNVEFIKCPIYNGKIDLEFLFKTLFDKKVMSIFVEAGGILNGEIVSKGLADKIYQFIAPKILADNSAKACFDGRNINNINLALNYNIQKIEHFPPDFLVTLIK